MPRSKPLVHCQCDDTSPTIPEIKKKKKKNLCVLVHAEFAPRHKPSLLQRPQPPLKQITEPTPRLPTWPILPWAQSQWLRR